jgi:hypothetical protein
MRPYLRLTDEAKARVWQELAQEFALNNLRPAGGTEATDCHRMQKRYADDADRRVHL